MGSAQTITAQLRSAAGHRRAVPVARTLIAVAAVGLSIAAIVVRWHDFSADLRRVGLPRMVTATPFMLAGLITGMLAWRTILAGLGSRLSLRVAGRIYFIGQLGKYLPGSVWPVLTQMELGRDHAIPRRRSVVALVIAIVTSLATGLAIAGLATPLLPAHYRDRLWWLLLPVPLLVGLLHPRVLWPLLRRIPRLRLVDGLAPPRTSTMLAAAAWSLFGWFLFGVHIAILVLAFHPHHLAVLVAVSIGGYALAWCAGLVVFILPAGAGARDLALVAALSAVVPSGPALAAAIICRVVTTGCDLGCAGVAMVGAPRPGRGDANRADPTEPTDDSLQLT